MALPRVKRASGPAALPTEFGNFAITTYGASRSKRPYYALIMGQVENGRQVLTRIHSACATGDIFRSRRCDCGAQLDLAQEMIAASGEGIIIYATDHEGRGIGEVEKIDAYALQDDGMDTFAANYALGHEADERNYGIAASILKDLGVVSVCLLTNNPDKVCALRDHKIEVTETIPLVIAPTLENFRYQQAKRRSGHLLPYMEVA